jgi:ATP-dependent DNA helicase DinG
VKHPMSEVPKTILSCFPHKEPRSTQVAVLNEIQKVFESGKKFIILEAPVGSGKSPIAIALARYFGDSHLITPRKSLQDQYYEDFSEESVLMKGRNAYPCTRGKNKKIYLRVINDIRSGQVKQPRYDEPNCGNAPCRNSKTVYSLCVEAHGECPYSVAIETAQEHHTVIHNIHSFVFQTNFGEKFQKRKLLVVDEAHEIENVIRGFIAKKFTLKGQIEAADVPSNQETIDDWCEFFSSDKFIPEMSAYEATLKEEDKTYVTERDKYLEQILLLKDKSEYYEKAFTVKRSLNFVGSKCISTTFEFIPHSLGNSASRLMFDYGEYVVLMSGTIYDKNVYCRNIGLNPADVHFIRVPSTFPLKGRPIYVKPAYQVDTSYANWQDNFKEMTDKINNIMNIFSDVKGLIHVPSYDAGLEIANWLPPGRVMTHDKSNFQEKLQEFYASKEPKVFLSPVCQQGVDFKDDRARFQIILRIPYLNTSDEFVNHVVKNDFLKYNYWALVIFGQQIGRGNRSENDFCATFLMDSRFNKFLANNGSKLPKWLKDAFIYK